MGTIRVILMDHTGARKVEGELPDDRPVSELIPTIVNQLGYSGAEHAAMRWVIQHKESGRRLGEHQTLAECEIKPNEHLLALPEIATFEPIEGMILKDAPFSQVALIITVVVNDAPLALAVPKQGTIKDLMGYLRARLRSLSPPIDVPASCSLYLKRIDDFLAWDASTADAVRNQDVIEIREVLKIEGL